MSFPTESEIAAAGARIRAGQLVAFPTETVYGLGANALSLRAVTRIFAAKGRPASSPLIVHVDSVEMARSLVREWPREADLLTELFWPGPLTLVLKKKRKVPDLITAGLPTVALRQPVHPVALALIRAAGVPIAAPSANRFTQLSPTTAEHVWRAGLADMVLDGGPSSIGIESTVLSLAEDRPVLLRPGSITVPQLESVVGPVEVRLESSAAAHASPGQHKQHYQPVTPLHLGGPLKTGRGAYLWLRKPLRAARSIAMPDNAAEYAAILYSTLHEMDAEHLDWIAVEMPPDEPEWSGVRDRLTRAGR
jgi:L-threonylcarbamoyladenylate synthase